MASKRQFSSFEFPDRRALVPPNGAQLRVPGEIVGPVPSLAAPPLLAQSSRQARDDMATATER